MFYWIFEYGKVLAVYLLIMFAWPSVVFHKYLNKKGYAFRFSFCTTFMILLINSAVLMLGLVKLLNPWVIRALFYGPVAYIAGKWLWSNREKAIHIKYLITGVCGPRRFFANILNGIGKTIKTFCDKLLRKIRPQLLLYIMLAVIVIYGMIYFSYGAFCERYYGASDIYVHHSWIYMMLEGNVFGSGIYPEGMHSFIYAMDVLFGVEVYSCLLFIAGIHIFAFLVSAYLFLREMFSWKFSGVFALILYLILRLDSTINIASVARMQWALPQEFALYTVFLCGAYLLRFLRQVPVSRASWKRWKFCRDENLLIFLMALAVSISVHFYVTIMAFFLCAAIGVFFLIRVFTKKQVVPLLAAIMCGLVIAVIPMLTAWAIGYEFQGSIGWALGVIEGSKEETEKPEKPQKPDKQEKPGKAEESQESEEPATDSQPDTDDANGNVDDSELIPPETSPEEENAEQKEPQKNILVRFYEKSFATLYRKDRAVLLAGFLVLGALLGFICHICAAIRKKKTVADDRFCGYLFLTTSTLFFMMLFVAPSFGFPELIQISRLGSIIHFLTLAAVMIPLDLIMTHISKKRSRLLMDICAGTLCLAMCVSVIAMGEYHGYLYYVFTRYPAAVEVTNQIIQNMAPQSFTVVSAVDELYHIKEYGYHEEAVAFIQKMNKDTYTLPTEYVFIYIEKQPLAYAHNHLLAGPSWLAKEAYKGAINGSQCPEVKHSEISDEYADKNIFIPISSKSYSNLTYRTIIFSKLHRWAERFQEMYPYQMTTVYEDDAFVCYMFQQNPARLLELAIMD